MSSASGTSSADRGFTWSDEETSLLLQLWSTVHAQTIISNGSKKSFNIFEKVSEEMNNLGYLRSTSQCKEKIKRMKREYTVTKQRNQFGKMKKTMRFYEQFEQILQAIQNKSMEIATIQPNPSGKGGNAKEGCQKENKTKSATPQMELRSLRKRNQPVEQDVYNPWSPDVVIIEEDEERKSTSASTPTSSGLKKDVPAKKRRKVSSNVSGFQSIMNSLNLKFLKYQTESEEKLLNKLEEIESERNDMDERIKKMWQEFEERRKADEKEHELKLLSSFEDVIKTKNSFSESKQIQNCK